MRWRIIIIGAVVLGLGLVVGWPIAAHYRAKGRIARYWHQLQAAGEKLTIAELTPTPSPEGARASFDLIQAASRLRTTSPNWSNYPPTMKYIGPGKALVGWQQGILPTTETTNIWPGLRGDVEANQDALAEIRAALRAPLLAFDPDYHLGAGMLLPHLSRFKCIAQWLAAATVLELHEGRITNAWDNLVALTALAGRQRDEPVIISELVRIAIAAIAVNTAWEALQSTDCTDAQLQNLQAAWQTMDFLSQAEAALAMERATVGKEFARARDSYAYIANGFALGGGGSGLSELAQLGKEVVDNPQAGVKAVVHRYPGYWHWQVWQSYEDELAGAEISQAALKAVRQARQERILGPALQPLERDARQVRQAHPRAGIWLGYSPADSAPRFLSRIALFEIERSLLVTAIALKRYHLRHGAYPTELAALTPEILTHVPRDVMDGQPLRYRCRADGSFLLYSVGEDGVDNGGDPTPGQQASKQWLRARDIVWPAPADPGEVRAALKTVKN